MIYVRLSERGIEVASPCQVMAQIIRSYPELSSPARTWLMYIYSYMYMYAPTTRVLLQPSLPRTIPDYWGHDQRGSPSGESLRQLHATLCCAHCCGPIPCRRWPGGYATTGRRGAGVSTAVPCMMTADGKNTWWHPKDEAFAWHVLRWGVPFFTVGGAILAYDLRCRLLSPVWFH